VNSLEGKARAFPYCPRCAGLVFHRQHKFDSYERMTCGLFDNSDSRVSYTCDVCRRPAGGLDRMAQLKKFGFVEDVEQSIKQR
jgi:hypothetical protein